MKLLTREEFLALKPPVLYSRHKNSNDPCPFGLELMIKSLENDWIYMDLVDQIEAHDSTEYFNTLAGAELSNSFEFNGFSETCQRDGMFDRDERFFVFSKDEFSRFVNFLQAQIGAGNEN